MLRLGLAQINTTVGDIAGNGLRIRQALTRARSLGAQVVAFPELAVTGYPPEDLLLKPDFVQANLGAVEDLASATGGLVAIVGFVDVSERVPGALHNAAAILANGRLAGTYRKRRLPNYGVFDEKRYFREGHECPVFYIGEDAVGVTICEDIWYPGGPPQLAAESGAVLVVNINASPYHAGKWQDRETMLRTRATAYGAIIAYVNMVGGQDELVFDGASVVIGHDGRVLARGHQFAEDLIVCDLDLAAVRAARVSTASPRAPRLRGISAADPADSRESGLSTDPEDDALPTPAVLLPDIPPPLPPSPGEHIVEPFGRIGEIYRALELGLRDYVRKNGFRDIVLGLSGGIDSALVATLAADALGPEHVHAVFMPSPYTSGDSRRLAGDLARALGIRSTDIGIGAIFDAFLAAVAPSFASRQPDVAEENIQARIRGTLLMALSNKFGWLLLTTGNKSEYSCGYATLYGDMAGGFALIKDVPKTLVYELARWRNARGAVIPDGIIRRPPTAELRQEQLDTDSLPPYDVLDPILELYVERDMPPDAIVQQGHDRATVERVVRMVDRSEYKRRQAPPGVKITIKAFGRDRRLPITNGYRGGLTS
jgi:NAD+ synthase (glutamine-hydrolysing)